MISASAVAITVAVEVQLSSDYEEYWEKVKEVRALFDSVGSPQSDVWVDVEVDGADVVAIMQILPHRGSAVGFPPGDFGLRYAARTGLVSMRRPRRRAEAAAKRTAQALIHVRTVLERLTATLTSSDAEVLRLCSVKLTIEGHVDGQPVREDARYLAQDPIVDYPFHHECCWWTLSKSIFPNDRLENEDIAFLRAYYTKRFVDRSAFGPFVKQSNLVVRESCQRGGCLRKVVLIMRFEDLLKDEYRRFTRVTKWALSLKVVGR